ncbi:hypothetical protein P3X46_032597 [Hevea brasiliensis]|uniref:DUF946 domain-containing protein n=1 Tax=Hevea brasiliensis TaxID=3981 RepID=A0ABQ9KFN2_HEVBR|nr:hypothetical protein At1g04090 [Hevea brasiliensis]KAJ9135411.1 hypothetical protein P3X46_032597 [Hevea brasiliensis]
MGNRISSSKNPNNSIIDTSFKLPSPLPTWAQQGKGFASGTIDLGGLEVRQISSFNKVWATYEGGPQNLGASFFDPSEIPEGFFMLGSYTQPNNRPLNGWVLVGKDTTEDHKADRALKKPTSYALLWSSESLKIKQDGFGYFWLPMAPVGYKAVGIVVTNSSQEPSLEKTRCVRSDLTDQCETDSWIWGPAKRRPAKVFNVFSLRPSNRRTKATGVCVGTFMAQCRNVYPTSLACLKNVASILSCMPEGDQIEAIFQEYSPLIYLHPREEYLPSSVTWYFNNGAMLYDKKGSKRRPIEAPGSNLPQGGSKNPDDGAYWLDLPKEKSVEERIKKGELQEAKVYLHIKPMLGGTFTDIAVWVFFPFNGPATIDCCKIKKLSLRRNGEHVGDWEHVTLRVSNFNGELWSVYFSQHSKGYWLNASELEYYNGNKVVAYASLHGHAMYSKPGQILQGCGGIRSSDLTAKSCMFLDTGARFLVVAADDLGMNIKEPSPWLNFSGKWGPKISYCKKVEAIIKCFKCIPKEVFGEEGPVGPKMKPNWDGDEVGNQNAKERNKKEELNIRKKKTVKK